MAPGTEFSLQTNEIDSVSLKGTGASAMEDQNNNNNNDDDTLEGGPNEYEEAPTKPHCNEALHQLCLVG